MAYNWGSLAQQLSQAAAQGQAGVQGAIGGANQLFQVTDSAAREQARSLQTAIAQERQFETNSQLMAQKFGEQLWDQYYQEESLKINQENANTAAAQVGVMQDQEKRLGEVHKRSTDKWNDIDKPALEAEAERREWMKGNRQSEYDKQVEAAEENLRGKKLQNQTAAEVLAGVNLERETHRTRYNIPRDVDDQLADKDNPITFKSWLAEQDLQAVAVENGFAKEGEELDEATQSAVARMLSHFWGGNVNLGLIAEQGILAKKAEGVSLRNRAREMEGNYVMSKYPPDLQAQWQMYYVGSANAETGEFDGTIGEFLSQDHIKEAVQAHRDRQLHAAGPLAAYIFHPDSAGLLAYVTEDETGQGAAALVSMGSLYQDIIDRSGQDTKDIMGVIYDTTDGVNFSVNPNSSVAVLHLDQEVETSANVDMFQNFDRGDKDTLSGYNFALTQSGDLNRYRIVSPNSELSPGQMKKVAEKFATDGEAMGTWSDIMPAGLKGTKAGRQWRGDPDIQYAVIAHQKSKPIPYSAGPNSQSFAMVGDYMMEGSMWWYSDAAGTEQHIKKNFLVNQEVYSETGGIDPARLPKTAWEHALYSEFMRNPNLPGQMAVSPVSGNVQDLDANGNGPIVSALQNVATHDIDKEAIKTAAADAKQKLQEAIDKVEQQKVIKEQRSNAITRFETAVADSDGPGGLLVGLEASSMLGGDPDDNKLFVDGMSSIIGAYIGHTVTSSYEGIENEAGDLEAVPDVSVGNMFDQWEDAATGAGGLAAYLLMGDWRTAGERGDTSDATAGLNVDRRLQEVGGARALFDTGGAWEAGFGQGKFDIDTAIQTGTEDLRGSDAAIADNVAMQAYTLIGREILNHMHAAEPPKIGSKVGSLNPAWAEWKTNEQMVRANLSDTPFGPAPPITDLELPKSGKYHQSLDHVERTLGAAAHRKNGVQWDASWAASLADEDDQETRRQLINTWVEFDRRVQEQDVHHLTGRPLYKSKDEHGKTIHWSEKSSTYSADDAEGKYTEWWNVATTDPATGETMSLDDSIAYAQAMAMGGGVDMLSQSFRQGPFRTEEEAEAAAEKRTAWLQEGLIEGQGGKDIDPLDYWQAWYDDHMPEAIRDKYPGNLMVEHMPDNVKAAIRNDVGVPLKMPFFMSKNVGGLGKTYGGDPTGAKVFWVDIDPEMWTGLRAADAKYSLGPSQQAQKDRVDEIFLSPSDRNQGKGSHWGREDDPQRSSVTSWMSPQTVDALDALGQHVIHNTQESEIPVAWTKFRAGVTNYPMLQWQTNLDKGGLGLYEGKEKWLGGRIEPGTHYLSQAATTSRPDAVHEGPLGGVYTESAFASYGHKGGAEGEAIPYGAARKVEEFGERQIPGFISKVPTLRGALVMLPPSLLNDLGNRPDKESEAISIALAYAQGFGPIVRNAMSQENFDTYQKNRQLFVDLDKAVRNASSMQPDSVMSAIYGVLERSKSVPTTKEKSGRGKGGKRLSLEVWMALMDLEYDA